MARKVLRLELEELPMICRAAHLARARRRFGSARSPPEHVKAIARAGSEPYVVCSSPTNVDEPTWASPQIAHDVPHAAVRARAPRARANASPLGGKIVKIWLGLAVRYLMRSRIADSARGPGAIDGMVFER